MKELISGSSKLSPPAFLEIGFAGHRRLADPPAIRQAVRTAMTAFQRLFSGNISGRSSAAEGADLFFLEACRDLEIPYQVVLPFQESRFRRDFSTEEAWECALSLINQASLVERIPESKEAAMGYHLAAMRVVENAGLMLFVWDGAPERGLGGTGETVQVARNRRIPQQIIEAQTARILDLQNREGLPEEFATQINNSPARGKS